MTYFTSQDARILIDRYGFSIFPVHGVHNGLCTCGNVDCGNKGKHPATTHGLKDATNDIDALKRLWAARQYLNVGVATGKPSNIFVIDIDGADGEDALLELGEVPNTLQVNTGRGRHLYFKYPGREVITKKGILPHVDVRGDGGYVCGAGSNHYTGATYEWFDEDDPILEAPDFILELVIKENLGHHTPQSGLNIEPIARKKSSLNLVQDFTQADIESMLTHISPDCGYDEWVQIGMAISDYGLPFSVWDAWSARGSKYNKHEMARKWNSFKGSGVSIGSLVHTAKQGGWRPERKEFSDYGVPQKTATEQRVEVSTVTTANIIDPMEDAPKIGDKPRGMQLIMADDIKPHITKSDFVQGLLADNQFSVVYGESNCGKTFFMTDLCFHIAQGKRWRDRRVDQGGVVYVALEGAYGLGNRLEAYRQHYNDGQGMPFAMLASQVDFMNPEGNINEFIELLKTSTEKMPSIRLIVIDTLARAIAGGDENSGQDMGMLVHHADLIRYHTGAHVCFVHHSGKDRARGARGHSSLRAAVDTEIEVSREEGANYSKVRVVKQREMEIGDEMAFTLKTVSIGVDTRSNEEITSCVVLGVAPDALSTNIRTEKLTDMQKFVYDTIVYCLHERGVLKPMGVQGAVVNCISYDDLRDALAERGFKDLVDGDKAKSTTGNVRVSLKRKGKIDFGQSFIWLTNQE